MSRLLPISIALLPLAIAPGLSLHYDVIPRLAVFEILWGLMALGAAAWLTGITAGRVSTFVRTFLGVSAALAIWMSICTLTSTDRSASLFGSTWREMGLITWLSVIAFGIVACGSFIRKRAIIASVLRAIALSGIAGAAYGILQYFGIDPLLPATRYHAGESIFTIVRTPGTLGHADYFAAWLVPVFFLVLPLARRDDRVWRWVAYTSLAACAVAILLSGTRGALVALLAGGVAAVALLRPKLHVKQLAAFVAPISLAVVFFFSSAGAPLRARVHWAIEDARGGARLLLWRDSLRMIAARPVQGYGPETYSFEFPKFQSVELARQYPDWYHESPHNAFLDAAAAEGIPGLLLTLALVLIGCASAWAVRRTDRVLSAALIAALVAQFMDMQFVALTLTGAAFLVLTIAVAVAVATPAAAHIEAGHVPRWAFVPAAAIALLFITYAVRLFGSDIELARFDRAIQRGQTIEAISTYSAAQRWSPSGRAADLYCSRRYFGAAQKSPDLIARLRIMHEAIVAGARATDTADDRQNAWYNLGMLTASAGDRAGVERCLRASISASPNWFRPHWALARLLQAEGRLAESHAEAARAADLDGGKDAEISAGLSRAAVQPVSPE